jgi:hypothetical protein
MILHLRFLKQKQTLKLFKSAFSFISTMTDIEQINSITGNLSLNQTLKSDIISFYRLIVNVPLINRNNSASCCIWTIR